MSVETVSVTEMRDRIADCIERVDTTRFVVQKHGQPRAYLIGVRELEALEETIAILEQPDLLARIQAGLEDVRAGRVQDARDAFAELDAEFGDGD